MEANFPSPCEMWGEEIGEIEDDIGVNRGYFHALQNEDDWSFIIKSNLFIEMALADLLVKHLSKPSIADPVARMSMLGKAGKLTIAIKLHLIDPRTVKFCKALTGLRNDIAHSFTGLNFKFNTHFASLPKSKPPRVGIFSFYEDGARGGYWIDMENEKRKGLRGLVQISLWWALMDMYNARDLGKNLLAQLAEEYRTKKA